MSNHDDLNRRIATVKEVCSMSEHSSRVRVSDEDLKSYAKTGRWLPKTDNVTKVEVVWDLQDARDDLENLTIMADQAVRGVGLQAPITALRNAVKAIRKKYGWVDD